jgi:hypothetical protein
MKTRPRRDTDVRGSDSQLHPIERFTRVDRDTLRYEFTVDNPTAFVEPWTAVIPMTRSTDRIFEYARHEANYALMDILRGAAPATIVSGGELIARTKWESSE